MRPEFIDRLISELYELELKIKKLYEFSLTEKFKELNEKHRELLSKQYRVMIKYQNILKERLEDLGVDFDSKK